MYPRQYEPYGNYKYNISDSAENPYEVNHYPHPINLTWGTWNKLMPVSYYFIS